MMINTYVQRDRWSLKDTRNEHNSSNNEQQTSEKAGLPNFMRAGSVEYGAEAANNYINEELGSKINSNRQQIDRNKISVTKLVLTESNGSDSGLERLPCGSDTYFDRSFDSD